MNARFNGAVRRMSAEGEFAMHKPKHFVPADTSTRPERHSLALSDTLSAYQMPSPRAPVVNESTVGSGSGAGAGSAAGAGAGAPKVPTAQDFVSVSEQQAYAASTGRPSISSRDSSIDMNQMVSLVHEDCGCSAAHEFMVMMGANISCRFRIPF